MVCEGCDAYGFSAPHICLGLVLQEGADGPRDWPCQCNVEQACASWRPFESGGYVA